MREEQTGTLQEFLHASHSQRLLVILLLLARFTAGCTDVLCFLSLSHVFASFMTGNLLFIGLGAAQGNYGLLLRAIIAVLVYLLAIVIGSFVLERVPQQQIWRNWLSTFIRYLLVEWVVLLTFALLWLFTGNPATHQGIQITLLTMAAFAMGIQGALIGAFKFPGIVANALTGTVLLFGQRLAQGANRHTLENAWEERNTWFLALLCLVYIFSAFVVGLTVRSLVIPFIPVLLITVELLILLASLSKERHR
jgi:uncharacterized membrane protein YoaK (UPF0700 family)